MLTDDGQRTDDGRTTDARVTGILIAHLGAFGPGELKTVFIPDHVLFLTANTVFDQSHILTSCTVNRKYHIYPIFSTTKMPDRWNGRRTSDILIPHSSIWLRCAEKGNYGKENMLI